MKEVIFVYKCLLKRGTNGGLKAMHYTQSALSEALLRKKIEREERVHLENGYSHHERAFTKQTIMTEELEW